MVLPYANLRNHESFLSLLSLSLLSLRRIKLSLFITHQKEYERTQQRTFYIQ